MKDYPFPPETGSAIVAYNNIKALSKKHSISIICKGVQKERGDIAELGEHVEFVSDIEFTNLGGIFSLIKMVRSVFLMLLGVPTLVSMDILHRMRERVNELTKLNTYDAILMYEMYSIQYCPPSSYKKVVVNIEDPQSIRLSRIKELPVWPIYQRIKLLIYQKITENYERQILPRMAKVLVLSESDMCDMIKQGGYDNLECVSYGVTKKAVKEIIEYESRTEGMIVFSGNMYHPANIDGALFFLENIYSLVLFECPYATLWIVGANPDTRIGKAAARFGQSVIVTGRVNDISEYLQYAMVSICPVRLKIGVQTKILEALSWGTPVVATSAGNSGVCGSNGIDLWIEDEPDKFAKRVAELLRGQGWLKRSEKGRQFVTECFSWERSATELERHLERILVVD